MFNLPKKDKRTDLERERDNAVLLLMKEVPNTAEYDAQLKVVERLQAMVQKENELKVSLKPSPDAAVAGAVGVFQVLAILQHERCHNVMSKAINFVLKGRVR